jgi:hypothetical protein
VRSALGESPAGGEKRKKSNLWGFEAPRESGKKKREREMRGESVRFSNIDPQKFNTTRHSRRAAKFDLSLCSFVNMSVGLRIPGWCFKLISLFWTASRTVLSLMLKCCRFLMDVDLDQSVHPWLSL